MALRWGEDVHDIRPRRLQQTLHAVVGLGHAIGISDGRGEVPLTIADPNHLDRRQPLERAEMLVADETAADQTDPHATGFGRMSGWPRIEAGAA